MHSCVFVAPPVSTGPSFVHLALRSGKCPLMAIALRLDIDLHYETVMLKQPCSQLHQVSIYIAGDWQLDDAFQTCASSMHF